MTRTILAFCAFAACASAQFLETVPFPARAGELNSGIISGPGALPVESIPFRAVLSAANEVPPVDLAASGTATVWLRVVREQGQIVSGSVDFVIRYRFPASVTLTGLHIHSGRAGTNGPVVLNSGLTRMEDSPAEGVLRFQGQILPTNAAGLAALRGVLEDPQAFYVNLHTSAHPAGAIRGQVDPARTLVQMTQLDPGNEVPPVAGLGARGTGTLMVIAGMRPNGHFSSAEAIFDVNYTGFPEGTNFTGLHIHTGAAGVNGPVTIDSTLRGPIAAVAGGPGSLRFEAEVNMGDPRSVATLYGLFSQPAAYYMNLHTQANPGGAIRGQMRHTGRSVFHVTMLPGNEVPPLTGLDAAGYAAFTLHTLRNSDGHVLAGVAVFDINYRFPGETQFTGLHIHDNVAGANGPVTLDSGLSRTNEPLSAGFGNIYRWRTQDSNTAFQSMNSVVIFPERHYLNLHTTVNPPGAVRGQLAEASAARPRIWDVMSGVSDPRFRTLAPLGLFTIFGENLFRAPAAPGSFESSAPLMLNGTTVTVGGREAAILTLGREAGFVPADYIVAQAPAALAPGAQEVLVSNSNGPGMAASVSADHIAPGLYFDAVGAIAFRASDMTLIRPGNEARAGEQIWLLMTGLGEVAPGLGTGQIAPASPAAQVAGPLQVSIGGRAATGVSATAWPGFAGFYRVTATVPEGVSGNVAVTVSQIPAAGAMPHPASSNTANIAVR